MSLQKVGGAADAPAASALDGSVRAASRTGSRTAFIVSPPRAKRCPRMPGDSQPWYRRRVCKLLIQSSDRALNAGNPSVAETICRKFGGDASIFDTHCHRFRL